LQDKTEVKPKDTKTDVKRKKRFDAKTFYSKGSNLDLTVYKNGVARYDPAGPGDWYINKFGRIWEVDFGGKVGKEVSRTHRYVSGYEDKSFNKLVRALEASYKKQGGKVNRINYFQQGGATQPSIEEQVISLVQAAMQGD
jgi:hypothetical protein